MFSKKAKVLISTAVLTALGVAFTGVASARIGGTARTIRNVAIQNSAVDNMVSALRPMHDGGEGRGGKMGAHLEAAATALGMTSDELKTALADGSSLADVAASKKVAVQKVIDAIVADEKAEIAQAVTDGKLTQAQADALQAKVVEHVTAIVNGERPAPLFGHGGRSGKMGAHLEAAATALGMTSDELKAALADGSSLADVAASKNVAVQKVVDAIVADEKAEIAQAVTDGKLTQAQADALQAKVVEHVTAIVNGERPAPLSGHGGRGGRGDHGGHGGHGHHGMGDDHSEADETSDA